MFRHKSRDIITLFHKPSSPASGRILTLLKQASAAASETATIDQASDHSAQHQAQRDDFDLEITEKPPTGDQLKTILEYVGGKPNQIVKGANSHEEAVKKIKESGDNFQAPLVVDWNNGKAITGEHESEILKLLGMSKKGTQK